MTKVGAAAWIAASVLGPGIASAGGAGRSVGVTASPLTLVKVPVPHFRVSGFKTQGAMPLVRGSKLDLGAVTRVLRTAVIRDQRDFAHYARRDHLALVRAHPRPGDPYRTGSWGGETRSSRGGGELVLVDEAPEQVASPHMKLRRLRAGLDG
jgi:hypothetical protein